MANDFNNKTIMLWANDSAGSYNLTSTRTVTVDVINPVVNIQQPTSSTYNYNEGLPLNFTAIDTNRDTCWYNSR